MGLKVAFSRRFLGVLLLGLLCASLTLSGCKKAKTEEGTGNLEADLHLRKAQKLIRKGDFEAAFMHLNKAMAIKPNDPGIHRDMGWVYLYTDQPEKATDELKRLEDMAPDSPEADYLAGAIYDYLEQPNEASRYYLLAIKGNERQKGIENNAELYFDLATSLNEIDRHKAALFYLQKGFKLLPKSTAADAPKQPGAPHDTRRTNYLFAICSTQYYLKDYKKALLACSEAANLTTDPKERETITDFTEKMKLLQLMDVTHAQDAEAEDESLIKSVEKMDPH